MMGTQWNRLRAGLITGLLWMSALATMATIQVTLDGQPLAFSVPPAQVNGRTLVPLRGVFEALGAQVQWNGATQTITARKDATHVQLVIGNPIAVVNARSVVLDAPAMVQRGATLVPLRFVSEALGADVQWHSATHTVVITTTATVTVPVGTVIPVTLDTAVSSVSSVQGDTVTATVRSARDGDAEFPRGTKLHGVISEAMAKTAERPGVLALTFQDAVLPDGRHIPLTGSLWSLDAKSVTRAPDGRLTANGATVNDTLKFIAIGAGAGLVVGKLADKDLLTSSLLGAVAGYVYSTTNKEQIVTLDVTVKEGTEFGVRLDRELSFTAPGAFAAARAAALRATAPPAP